MYENNQQIISLEKSNINVKRLKSIINLIFQNENISPDSRLSIIITNNKNLQELNKEYKNLNNPTDVLSFQFDKDGFPNTISILGDVYISLDKAKEQSKYYDVSLQNEVERLMIHGILHLIGYTHNKKKKAKEMEEKTKYYINTA
ncbi:MAG: rRNA maturation RNase YbeY [Candidatus Cloacimonetes bacterium]|nr:rRNA maturation RNase YbeY [Candidatus Cloacimonadota bacterium]MBL7086783.1 rRNA maturation RNase YbeY [Candidatus Cloacimonadota bacterium]